MAILVNFTKMQYIRPEPFGDDFSLEGLLHTYDGCPMMLAILLADGNGRGGGDLHAESDLIGSWAGDRIGVITAFDIVPEFSLPGKESEPLLPQIIEVAKDISADITAVIQQGEGRNFVPTGFLRDCAIPLTVQKRIFKDGDPEQIKENKGANPDLLWRICGAEFRFTNLSAMRSLQKGIETMYQSLHQKNVAVTIEKLSTTFAADKLERGYNRGFVETKSLGKLTCKLTIDDGEKKRKVSLKVERGFDIQEVFFTLFEVNLFKPKLLKTESDAQKAKDFVQQLIAGAA